MNVTSVFRLTAHFSWFFCIFAFAAEALFAAQDKIFRVENQKQEYTGYVLYSLANEPNNPDAVNETWQTFDRDNKLIVLTKIRYDKNSLEFIDSQTVDYREDTTVATYLLKNTLFIKHEDGAKKMVKNYTVKWHKSYSYFELMPQIIRKSIEQNQSLQLKIFSPLLVAVSNNMLNMVPIKLDKKAEEPYGAENKSAFWFDFVVDSFFLQKVLPDKYLSYRFIFDSSAPYELLYYRLGEYSYKYVTKIPIE